MKLTACSQDLEFYVLDALSPEERATVEAHLRTCAFCREEAALLRESLQEPSDTPAPAALRRRLHREIRAAWMREAFWTCRPVWLRAAAALVAALGLGYAMCVARSAWSGKLGNGRAWTQTGICSSPGAHGSYPVVNGRVVVAIEKKEGRQILAGLNRETGAWLWESPFGVAGTPVADGSRVYVWRAGCDNRLVPAALDMASGREIWSADPATASGSPWPLIAVRDGVAWSGDGSVTVLDGTTGAVRWELAIANEGALSAPSAGSGRLYVASVRALRAFDATDGRLLWRCEEPQPAALRFVPPLAQCDGRLVVVARTLHPGDGIVCCHDAATGARVWSRETEMPWHMAMAEGRVFLRGAQIQALEGRSGRTVWSVDMGGCSPVEVLDGLVYIVEGLDRKGIFALRADSGRQVWAQRMLSSCSGFSVAGRMGYLSTQDGTLRAVAIRPHGS